MSGDPPNWWPQGWQLPSVFCAPTPTFGPAVTAEFRFQPTSNGISDEDVERIARRVAELLREPTP